MKISNVFYHNITLEGLIHTTINRIKSGQRTVISLSNPEFILEANRNKKLFDYLNRADFNVADGAGIVWASKLLYKKPLIERVTGTDFLPALITASKMHGFTFYFLGGKPGIADRAIQKFKKEFGYNGVIGSHHGFFDQETEQNILREINELKPDILMVCLGNPKQEEWIEQNLTKLDVKVVFGNGGALDFWSENVKRAPLWMRKHSMEWIFRLFQDFSRNRLKRQSRLLIFPFIVYTQFVQQGFRRK